MRNKIKIIGLFLIIFFLAAGVRAQEESLTNQSIIALTRAGAGKDLIIEKIHETKTDFDLSETAIINLKAEKVEDAVIIEMLRAKKRKPTSQSNTKSEDNNALPDKLSETGKNNETSDTNNTTKVTNNNPNSNNTPTGDTTKITDPTCIQAQLDAANTGNRVKDVCNLVLLVTAEDPAEIVFDNSSRAVLSLVLGDFLKKNKIALSDAEKTQAAVKFFLDADKKRTDKQIGSNPNSSGTTTLAVKGGAPSVIGWAIERGAATSSIDGTTVTVRVNPFGMLRALSGEGFLGRPLLNNLIAANNKRDIDPSFTTSNFLRKFSLGFSFDTTRGQETPTFIVSKQQLSAVSARYEFINERTPQSSRAQKLFRSFVLDVKDILDEYGKIIIQSTDESGVFRNQALKTWLDVTNAEIKTIKRFKVGDLVDKRRYEEAIREVIEKRLEALPVEQILNDSNTKQIFQRFAELTLAYVEKREKFAEEVNKGKLVTFEYTNGREPVAPDTSNFRFIYEDGSFFKNTDLTFNASMTMYNKKPAFAGVKRLRDFQFALQTETQLNDTFGTGRTTLAFAGRYERLNGDTVDKVTGIVTPGTKGDIAVGQIKFTIPISDWGIKLPLSMTFANRSEFIKESHVQANFGFTFDLDPIFARLRPF